MAQHRRSLRGGKADRASDAGLRGIVIRSGGHLSGGLRALAREYCAPGRERRMMRMVVAAVVAVWAVLC
ncbi:MAG: hypothetical protein ACK5PT_04610, partial [Cereibacter sp.]